MAKKGNNKKRQQEAERVQQTDEVEQPLNATIKDKMIENQTRIKEVKQSMKLTGKSKEYINSLSQKGCPFGRKKCCCSLKHCKKTLNVRKNGGQNKSICMLSDVSDQINENKLLVTNCLETTEIGDEEFIKDFEVILLSE